jgi:3-hydroxyacyl-CoA dehydrogenase/enoyl-CoA hydratase/3-hydroxybutyryl-CoA epimerase
MKACWCRSTRALRIEQRYFTKIMQTKEAAAMIRSLFVSLQELNKGARRPAGVPKTKFKKIGVLGAGFMGASIAYVTAKAGIPVVLLDRDMEAAEKGKAHSDNLDHRSDQEGPREGRQGQAACRSSRRRATMPISTAAISSSRRCSRIPKSRRARPKRPRPC